MIAAQIAAVLGALACFSSFVWAIRRFFRVEGAQPRGMRAISGFGSLFMLTHLLALGLAFDASWLWTSAGLGLYALSLAVFWSAIRANRDRALTIAFSEDAPEHLVQAGPYRWVRHPFYLSYSLAWIAGAAASGQPLLLLTALIMHLLYARAAELEERKFSLSPLGSAYAQYKARTGRFLPRLS